MCTRRSLAAIQQQGLARFQSRYTEPHGGASHQQSAAQEVSVETTIAVITVANVLLRLSNNHDVDRKGGTVLESSGNCPYRL